MDETRKNEMEEGVKTIDVTPLKKWNRFLSFLADYFLTFIFGLLLFHLGAFPLGSVATKAPERYDQYLSSVKERDYVLYGNNLLFFDERSSNKNPESFTINLDYTCKQYIGYYLGETEESREIFKNYYTSLAKNKQNYISVYQGLKAKLDFFDIGETTFTLKEEYKSEFSALFTPGDEMSSKGYKDYESFQNEFFLRSYTAMLSDIQKDDLTYNGVSYKANQKIVSDYKRFADVLVIASALISYFISSMVVSLLLPIITSHQKTLGNLVLRYERVDTASLSIYQKKKVPLLFIYYFAMNASCILFIPWGNVGFNELFSLPMLLPLSVVALALSLVSLAFLLFDPFNRDLMDRLSFTVMVSQSSMADIYRAKGYDF